MINSFLWKIHSNVIESTSILHIENAVPADIRKKIIAEIYIVIITSFIISRFS